MSRFAKLVAGVSAGLAAAAALVVHQYRATEGPAASRDLTLAGSDVATDHQLAAVERGMPTATARQARWSVAQPAAEAAAAPAVETAEPLPEIEAPAPVDLPPATPAPVPTPVPAPEPAEVAAAVPSGSGVMSLAPGVTVSAVPLPAGSGDLPVSQASWPSKLGAMDQGPAPTFGTTGGGRCRGQGGTPTGLVLR